MTATIKKMNLPVPPLKATKEVRFVEKPATGTIITKGTKKSVMEKARRNSQKARSEKLWTDEERQRIREMRDSGASWDDIAKEFGVSKNSTRGAARKR